MFYYVYLLFSGDSVLGWMGITLSAFRIAGGLLLFLLSLEMVFARQSGLRSTTSGEQNEAEHKQDISIFPLAFPLLAGPGALTTVMLIAGQIETVKHSVVLRVVIFVVCAITLLGLILAALAVQYVIDGIKQRFLI